MTKSVPIRFRTAEEFKNRPAWRDGLDPSQHTLKEIIGDYHFPKKDALACGLKNCRTIHQRGYVVVTVDELETHIGNRCGTRYFGVNWGTLSSAYDQAIEARDAEEWLNSVLSQREVLLSKAQQLLEALYGENEKIRDIRDRLSKDGVVLNAFERAARAGGAIQVDREVDEETANARGLPESQRHYFETVGRIFGIEAAVPPKGSLRLAGSAMADQLREVVMPDLTNLSATSLRNLNARQQKIQTKALEAVHTGLVAAERFIEISRRFTAPSNLREIGKLPIHRLNDRIARTLRHFAQLPN